MKEELEEKMRKIERNLSWFHREMKLKERFKLEYNTFHARLSGKGTQQDEVKKIVQDYIDKN